MEGNHNDITKLFTDKIESYEMPVSDKVWESLDNKLDKKALDKYKAIVFRLRLVIASFIFLIVSFGLYFFLNPNSKPYELAMSKQGTVVQVVSDSKITHPSKTTNNFDNKSRSENLKGAESNLNKVSNSKNSTNSIIPENTTVSGAVNKKVNLTSNTFKTITPDVSKSNLNQASLSNDTLSIKTTDNLLPTEEKNISVSIPTTSTIQIEPITISEIKADTIHNAITKTANSDTTITSTLIPELKTNKEFIHRFSIAGYFSPDFTQKYLVDRDKNDNQTQSEYDGKETPDFSFNTGLIVGYDLTSKWTIKTGVTYIYLMQSIMPKTVYSQTGMDGSSHYQFSTSYGNAQIPNDASPAPQAGDSLKINTTSTQLFQMISVPIMAKYNLQRNKFSYYVQFGLSTNFLISQKLLVETPNGLETITNIEGLKKINFGGIVGCGIAYNPIKKLSIMVEPTFRGFLAPINQGSSVKSYPYALGLSIGLGWHF